MNVGPRRDFTRLAAAIVIAAVVISAAIVASSRLNSPIAATTTTVVQSIGGIDCATAQPLGEVPPPAGLPLNTGTDRYQCERVLVIPSGPLGALSDYSGVLVVSYESNPSAVCPRSAGCTPIANLTSSILAPSRFGPVTIPEQINLVNASGIEVTASPSSIDVTQVGTKKLNVTYTITVSAGVKGFFLLSYLNACPSLIPLAVGYDASQINASAFPYYQPFLQGCTNLGMLPGGTLISTSGIQTVWLVQTVQQGSTIAG